MLRANRLIILAAGTGTRLRPLTDDRPKALVPLAGRPLLDWQLAAARQCGMRDVVVVGGHRADRLAEFGLTTVLNTDYEQTNMVHSLFAARAQFGEGFIFAYGDIAYRAATLKTVIDGRGSITVAVDRDWRAYWAQRFDDPLSDAETLRIGADGNIREIGRKPESYDEIDGQYVGLVGFDAKGVRALCAAYDRLIAMGPDAQLGGRPLARAYMTDLLQALAESGEKLTPAWIDGGWVEIDSCRDLDVAEQMVRLGRLDD